MMGFRYGVYIVVRNSTSCTCKHQHQRLSMECPLMDKQSAWVQGKAVKIDAMSGGHVDSAHSETNVNMTLHSMSDAIQMTTQCTARSLAKNQLVADKITC